MYTDIKTSSRRHAVPSTYIFSVGQGWKEKWIISFWPRWDSGEIALLLLSAAAAWLENLVRPIRGRLSRDFTCAGSLTSSLDMIWIVFSGLRTILMWRILGASSLLELVLGVVTVLVFRCWCSETIYMSALHQGLLVKENFGIYYVLSVHHLAAHGRRLIQETERSAIPYLQPIKSHLIYIFAFFWSLHLLVPEFITIQTPNTQNIPMKWYKHASCEGR